MTVRMLTGLGVVLLSVGCSSISTNTDHDPDFDFSGLNSFYWIDGLALDDSFLGNSIRGSVAETLVGKGFEESLSDGVLGLSYQVTTEPSAGSTSSSSSEWGRSGWGRGWDGVGMSTGGGATNVWQEGTLILEVFDTRTKNLVWRGSATTELSGLRTREDREQAIDAAVKKLLGDFPPGT